MGIKQLVKFLIRIEQSSRVMLAFIILSLLLLGIECSNRTLPEWKDLECEVSHQAKNSMELKPIILERS